MKRILAIAGLTWKSAFRYRLFWILAVLLIGAVVGLPLVIKDDGTAKGLTQILLTYTLGAVAALLGMATLWLSCGTLARDVEECQIQVVSVKPIARWEIWMGKWFGILGLNAALLGLSGACIFFLLQYRASKLPAAEQKVLRDEIFVSRASIKEPIPDLTPQVDAAMKEAVRQTHATEDQIPELRKNVTEQVKAAIADVPPGYQRMWVMDMHTLSQRAQNDSFRVRVKFHTSNPNSEATYDTYWRIGPPGSVIAVTNDEVLPADSFQEFPVPAGLLDPQGRLFVDFVNPNSTSLMFPIEDGFELLYYESSFGMNFIRGLLIIFFWLALLSAIGLSAASHLSFPVAAFASIAILILGLSSGTLQTVVEQGTIVGYDSAKGGYGHSPVDLVFVPVFNGLLKIIQLVESFSPIDFLSTGRSITWMMLGRAILQIVVILGGFFCLMGIILFSRRELATAQSNN